MEHSREREIQALISMVDDPDPAVFDEIATKIVGYGPNAYPFVEDALLTTPENALRSRLEAISRKILFNRLASDLARWTKQGQINLLEAWLHVARYFDPGLNEQEVQEAI